jgi:hypothetical protein
LYNFIDSETFRGGTWGGKKIFRVKYVIGFSGGKVEKNILKIG